MELPDKFTLNDPKTGEKLKAVFQTMHSYAGPYETVEIKGTSGIMDNVMPRVARALIEYGRKIGHEEGMAEEYENH